MTTPIKNSVGTYTFVHQLSSFLLFSENRKIVIAPITKKLFLALYLRVE